MFNMRLCVQSGVLSGECKDCTSGINNAAAE